MQQNLWSGAELIVVLILDGDKKVMSKLDFLSWQDPYPAAVIFYCIWLLSFHTNKSRFQSLIFK